jgi:uncharacterized FAD-dependent dehydrogenase
MNKKIVVIGAGVAGINAVTKLIDNGYPGELITVFDKGKNPYERLSSEIMEGFLGSGGWSDGKLTYHTSIGGHLSKYCGEEKAYQLMWEVIQNFTRFHPKPEEIKCSNPKEEPEFIKPYFNLRLFSVYHIGTDYLLEIAKNWYEYLLSKGVNFKWEHVAIITFLEHNKISIENRNIFDGHDYSIEDIKYDKLIIAVGKGGINLTQNIIEQYNLPTEPKSVQIGVRFEAPQHHFQKLLDISYDFKLYKKYEEEGISIRSFCVNSNAAYIAVEETYGDISYNGHAKKDEKYKNNMVNFGIIMEIKGIENPFEWSRKKVSECQAKIWDNKSWGIIKTGLFYSPDGNREPSFDSENNKIKVYKAYNVLDIFKETFEKYAYYILDFIEDLKKVFPTLKNDWGIYIPEVKYLSLEPLVNYKNLSLLDYPNVYFIGDAISSRSITVSGAQGIYCSEYILKENNINKN